MSPARLWKRGEDALTRRILGLNDTPRSIAGGVLLGTIVAFTPTLGFQIVIYVALATLLRVNKVSGIPVLFISNPFTVVPVYYFVWRVGDYILNGGGNGAPITRAELRQRLSAADVVFGDEALWRDVLDPNLWITIGRLFIDLGGELWLGALVCGLVLGSILYGLTLWNVRAFRKVRTRISLIDFRPRDGGER